MIGHSLSITLHDMCQIFKGIRHFTRLVHHPCLLSFSQETLHTLADNRASDIQYEIWHIVRIITYQIDSLIQERVHRLSADEHRALRLEKHPRDITQRGRRDISRDALYLPFDGKLWDGELEKGLGDRDVNMHRSVTDNESLVNETVAVPAFFLVMGFRQGYGLLDEAA